MEKALNLKEPPKTTRNKEEISQLMIYINLPIGSLSLIISNNPKIVNIIDNKKETILSYAMRDKKEDICLLILTSKVLDLSYQDKNGNSYLHLAVLNKLEKITQMLIEKGININRQNKNGNTALHLAYIKNLETMILILKNNKADRTIRNKDKKLAEDLKNNKKKELAEPASLGRTTKANSKKKNKSNNNNSKLTAKSSTTNNDDKKNVKSIKETLPDSKNLKINLLFDYGKKSNIKKKENLPTLRDTPNNQKKENPKVKDLSKLFFFQKTDAGKKGKYKKLVKENMCEKKLAEENSISNKKINIENNTSSETKFKSGTCKDKVSKTNNIEEKEHGKSNENKINFDKDDDIFLNDIDNDEIQFTINPELNNYLKKKYPFMNSLQGKEFQEDDEVYMKESYEKLNKKCVEDVINSFKNNNDKDNNENDSEYVSQIYEDDEYIDTKNLRFDDNKNNESSDDEIMEKNRSSFNILENSLINSVLKKNNKNIAKNKTRNDNNTDQLKIKNETNRETNIFDLMNEIQYSKTIANNKNNNKNQGMLKKNLTDDINNNEFGNDTTYQLYPDNEDKYNHKLSDLINNNIEMYNVNEKNKIKINEDLKEPILLPELGQAPNDIEEIDDINKNNSLKEFLFQINMQKYINNFIESGFDDMKIIIEQAQKGIFIKDSELKEAGILIPGHRAKILIRIQEKAGNFRFSVPKSVYYVCKNLNHINNDINIKNLRNWLKNLRIENYLTNFINNGYHSLELLFLQMESPSPLTIEILKEEIGIDKIGHRSRIINKLKEDGRSYINKLKTAILLVGNNNNNKFCDCIVF